MHRALNLRRALRYAIHIGVCAALFHAPAAAQHTKPAPEAEWRSSWSNEMSTLAVNALVGGITASIPHLRGAGDRSVVGSFLRGALGGGVGYAGKRVAVERWSGAGFVGREVSAVGASMIANAGAGRPLLSEVVLPLGPLRVHARASDGLELDARLDLAASVAIVYASTRPDTRLDLGQSLSAGAPVFFTSNVADPYALRGLHAFGVLIVEATEDEWDGQLEATATVFAHERVHVLQHDLALQAWAVPAQRWLLARVPGGAVLDRYVDVGLHSLPWAALNAIVPYDSRPWEREAYFLSRRPSESLRHVENSPPAPTTLRKRR